MNRATSAIVGGGLVGGAIDITFACIVWAVLRNASPIRVGQAVA